MYFFLIHIEKLMLYIVMYLDVSIKVFVNLITHVWGFLFL